MEVDLRDTMRAAVGTPRPARRRRRGRRRHAGYYLGRQETDRSRVLDEHAIARRETWELRITARTATLAEMMALSRCGSMFDTAVVDANSR